MPVKKKSKRKRNAEVNPILSSIWGGTPTTNPVTGSTKEEEITRKISQIMQGTVQPTTATTKRRKSGKKDDATPEGGEAKTTRRRRRVKKISGQVQVPYTMEATYPMISFPDYQKMLHASIKFGKPRKVQRRKKVVSPETKEIKKNPENPENPELNPFGADKKALTGGLYVVGTATVGFVASRSICNFISNNLTGKIFKSSGAGAKILEGIIHAIPVGVTGYLFAKNQSPVNTGLFVGSGVSFVSKVIGRLVPNAGNMLSEFLGDEVEQPLQSSEETVGRALQLRPIPPEISVLRGKGLNRMTNEELLRLKAWWETRVSELESAGLFDRAVKIRGRLARLNSILTSRTQQAVNTQQAISSDPIDEIQKTLAQEDEIGAPEESEISGDVSDDVDVGVGTYDYLGSAYSFGNGFEQEDEIKSDNVIPFKDNIKG